MLDKDKCVGEHDLFVIDCIAVESEGKVVVAVVCRHCGKIDFHEHIVALKNAPLRLLNEEKKEK